MPGKKQAPTKSGKGGQAGKAGKAGKAGQKQPAQPQRGAVQGVRDVQPLSIKAAALPNRPSGERPAPRMKVRYRAELLPALQAELELSNPMEVPRLEKIVLNMGVGDAIRDAKLLDAAMTDLAIVTGQKPAVRRARKSIAAFKLREGMPIGAMVTLRGDRMWEFLDRLVATALPRIRDFRGLNPDAFDGHGNYTLGVTEQLIFPEIDYDRVVKVRGMDITIVTTARSDEEGRALLRALGFPFAGMSAVSAAAS
jgi:large subunit ribosomal protein L5